MDQPAKKYLEVDESYRRLHQAIIQGELLPNQRLVELELAEQLGVGRAAIRTALDRLEQDGLVERIPNRGAHVRAITLEDAVEMFEARAVLEGLAARYAALRATSLDIAQLQAILAAMESGFTHGDLLGISDLNAELHAALLRIANHRTVIRQLGRLQAQHVHFQYRMLLVPGRAKHSLQEHRTIIEAIAAHDATAAENAMRQHLSQTVEALHKSAEPAPPR